MLFEHWGARADEIGGDVVGDHLVPDATLLATRSISLDAPPTEVYPWLAQMGFGKAGWYSYDWLDNLGRRSATEIRPDWQVDEGDPVPGGPIAFTAAVARPGEAFVLAIQRRRLDFTLAYELRPEGTGTRLVTRLRTRIDAPGGRLIERFVLGPGDGIMVRRQLLGLRERTADPQRSAPAADGRPCGF
ncbi:MAG: hypothetical protein AAGA37_19645 [Actinomycetota bacterium]